MSIRLVQRFFQLESSSGLLLLMMAVFAMVWANSPLAFLYDNVTATLLFWTNEGLMAIFFLFVGVELKRGLVLGPFSHNAQVLLPVFAALGGMFVPAILYGLINYHDPIAIRGWATPVATDIAFAVGVLSLFGKRVPQSLKLFLLALSIFDDLGAIIIIALFYSEKIIHSYLLVSAVIILALSLLNVFSIQRWLPYLALGVLLWYCFLKAGIHPTVAGVILAFAIPALPKSESSLLNQLERQLHPWVAYLIMPLFALVNAGVSLVGLPPGLFTSGVFVGIVSGLFIGKQIGVFGFSWILYKFRRVRLPHDTSLLALYGVSLLCGIGFTMSLFLGTLSFQALDNVYIKEVRLGVMVGSLLSGLVGVMILNRAFREKEA